MVIERHVKIGVTYCCACGEKLGLNRQVGVFFWNNEAVALCGNCSIQIKDLLNLLAMGGGFLKDKNKKNGRCDGKRENK